jgi:outer membrane protein assembly factor BamA
MKKNNLIILFLLFVTSLLADEKKDSIEVSKNFSMVAYPYVFYMPETGLAFGGSAIANFIVDAKQFNRPSQLMLNGYYTTIHNFSISFDDEVYFPKFSLHANIFYDKLLSKFYGYGNDAIDSGYADFEAYKYGFSFLFNRNIKTVLLGVIFDFSDWEITDYLNNPNLLNDIVHGSSGGLSSGLGISLGLDTRDYVFLPEKGYYHKINITYYNKVLGSNFNFIRYIVDLRKYWFFMDKISFAWQYWGEFVTGDTPFFYMPALGGSKIMRGYYEGRFRDKLYMATQAEAAIPINVFGIDRFSTVGFAAIGEVANKFDRFHFSGIKWSLGIGLRYLLNKKNRTTIRGEIGFGEKSNGIYFAAGTAF